MTTHHLFFTSLLMLGSLVACVNPPIDCAADGANCKQYNPDLDNHRPPPQNLPSPADCAADGPGCKQFNPDL